MLSDEDTLIVAAVMRGKPELVTEGAILQDHVVQMAALLASEWQAPGFVRSWHCQYRYDGELYHAALIQTKHVEGFQVALIGRQQVMDLRSGSAVSLRAACVWLGLDGVKEPLDWRHEL